MSTSIFTPELIAILGMFVTVVGSMIVFGINFTNRLARLETRFDGVDGKFDGIDKKFDDMDKKFDAIDKKFDGVDKKFDAMDKKFDGIDIKFDKVDSDIKAVNEKIVNVGIDVNEKISKLAVQISDVRLEFNEKLNDVISEVAFLKGNFAAQGASPLKLTPRGMQILKSIDGEKILDDNFEMLAGYIKEHTPTDSLFDILVTGRQIIKASINDILSREHKDKLYAIGADRYLVLDTLSIVLRDKYIQASIKAA